MQNRILTKTLERSCIPGILVFAVTTSLAVAQTQTNSPRGRPPVNPPVSSPAIVERPTVIPMPTAPEAPDMPARPDRPTIAERPEPAKAVKDLVKDFQSARQDFIRHQQELNRQLKTASDEQRAAIRAQLKDSLNSWLDEQKAHLQELRDQAKDIRNNVPSIKDVIDSAGGEGRGR